MEEDQRIIKQLECEKLKHERDNEYSLDQFESLKSQYSGKFLYENGIKKGEIIVYTIGESCQILFGDDEMSVRELRHLLYTHEEIELREE